MRKISNTRQADGSYLLSFGRQSKKLTATVEKVGGRWEMTLPSGEVVKRDSIKLLKTVFAAYVKKTLVTAPTIVKELKRDAKRRRACRCGNPLFYKFKTCLSCHYEKDSKR